MKKTVGIITLHFYENFGSVLQAYALKTAVERLTGYSAEIIPFVPSLPKYIYFQQPDLKRKYCGKKALFDVFRSEYCEIRESITEEQLNELQYDYYITGSDQVWNPEITGLHPAYFLNFVKKRPRIAYAASMAMDDDILNQKRECFIRYIPYIDYISLREKSSVPFIQQFSSKQVTSVLDPTMLLCAGDYEQIMVTNPVREPYLLSYFLTHDAALADYSTLLAKKMGLKVIHYYADYPACIFPNDSECFAFAGPREFLGLVKNAEMVFTNSFHGTVFSILFGRRFYTYTAKRKMLSRLLDITDMLELPARRVYDFRDICADDLPIDYTRVYTLLSQEQKKSNDFLLRALNGGTNV